MKQGKDTFFTFFKSKEGKINKITELTNSIASCERDIECLDLLHKIIVLQLNQAAIQFFKREKFATYNHTVHMYAAKVIGNTSVRLNLFRKLSDLNIERQQDTLDRSIRKAVENSVVIFDPKANRKSPTKNASPGSGPLNNS